MARLLYVPLWNLLRAVSYRPMRIDLQMECAAISICIARKTVSAFRQYNAPASLESSERKIKISKSFCIVGVARKTSCGCGEKIAKPLKIEFCHRW
jgi:hypothetical protein